MKNLFLPPTDPSNPLFRLESRRLRWGNRPHHYRTFAAIAGFCLIGAMFSCGAVYTISSTYNTLLISTQNAAIFGFIVSVGANILLDFVSMIFTVSSISGEINVKHWDLIRLSLIDRARVIEAKHSIANIRTWRMMAVILLFRCIVTFTFVLSMFIPYPYNQRLVFFDYLVTFSSDPIAAILLTLTVFTFFGIYLIEPVWRMSAQTAAGLAISSRIHHPLFGELAGLGWIVGIWIVQVIIIAFYGWITINMTIGTRVMIGAFCIILMACIGTAFTVRGFYKVVEQWGLDHALHHAFKND